MCNVRAHDQGSALLCMLPEKAVLQLVTCRVSVVRASALVRIETCLLAARTCAKDGFVID
jgi:hypothetical protein